MIRDSNPLRHGNGALFRAALAFAMLTSLDSLALHDLCPGPVPPIVFIYISFLARLELARRLLAVASGGRRGFGGISARVHSVVYA